MRVLHILDGEESKAENANEPGKGTNGSENEDDDDDGYGLCSTVRAACEQFAD